MGIDPATDLSLRVCTISGEQRSADAKERMERFWGGMKVREFYGGAEVPFIAAQAEDGSEGMHVNPDLIVEVVDPETYEPVDEGEPGVIVATDLRRVAYPMIRYFTGDITEGITTAPAPSGRTTPRIGRILGRHGDIPRVKGLFLVPGQIQAALDRVGSMGRFQVVIDRPGNQDTVTVRIETEGGAAGTDRTVVVAALKDETRLTCEVELVDVGTLSEDAPVIADQRTI